jgi:hypothetical protein
MEITAVGTGNTARCTATRTVTPSRVLLAVLLSLTAALGGCTDDSDGGSRQGARPVPPT